MRLGRGVYSNVTVASGGWVLLGAQLTVEVMATKVCTYTHVPSFTLSLFLPPPESGRSGWLRESERHRCRGNPLQGGYLHQPVSTGAGECHLKTLRGTRVRNRKDCSLILAWPRDEAGVGGGVL